MRIEQLELVEVRVPAHAGSVNSPERDKPLHKMASGLDDAWSRQFDEFTKVMLIATTDDGTVGYGETLRDPDLDVVEAMARRIAEHPIESIGWQQLPLPRRREYDAFELLVLDLQGKRAGVPVHTLLGGARTDRVLTGAWSGHRTPDDAAEVAAKAVADGYRTLKLKCDLEDDVVAIAEAVKRRCGDAITLIFDPNERFEELRFALDIARGLERVGNVLCLEDPLPRWDLGSFAELRKQTSVPIAVHVALGYTSHGQSETDVIRSIAERAADVFNFSACISDFIKMTHVADAARRPYWHGSEIDLGVMEAGYVHATATTMRPSLPSDIFGRRIRTTDLLTEPLEFVGDQVIVPTGPGLGVDLDRAALAAHEVSHRTLEFGGTT